MTANGPKRTLEAKAGTGKKAEIAELLSQLVAKLKQPLTHADEADGWDEHTWTKWGEIFGRLHREVITGGQLPDPSLVRAMDHDGIVEGALLEMAARISNLVRALDKTA